LAESEQKPKGQHFLLSAQCRTLTVMDLAKVREETAYGWFKRMRWPQTDGEPFCPQCGTLRYHTMGRGRFTSNPKGHLSADGRLPIRSSAAPGGSSDAAATVRRIWFVQLGYAALAQRMPQKVGEL
jgi:hypothetical protein